MRKIEAARPGIHGDGGTLFLRVRDGGSRQFVQIVSIDGKRVERGLGGYPRVSLREARELAFDNRRAIRRGRNPFENRPKRRRAASSAPTFADALAATLEIQRQSFTAAKTAADWQASMDTYAMPVLGGMAVDAVATADVEAVLKPIWHEKHNTAAKLKQRIHAVFKWAVAHGHRESNPVDAVVPSSARCGRTASTARRFPTPRCRKPSPRCGTPGAVRFRRSSPLSSPS